MPTLYVSHFLGHASLSTTTRYLNSTRRGLHWAMERFESARKERAEQAEAEKKAAAAGPRPTGSPGAQTLHTGGDRLTPSTTRPTRLIQPKLLVS